MFNREEVTVSCVTFSSAPDSYGQIRQTASTTTSIPMTIKPFVQNVDASDVRYNNADYVGWTKATISDANQIQYSGSTFNVLYVLPTKRYNFCYMKEV